jgi:hypothetical protein
MAVRALLLTEAFSSGVQQRGTAFLRSPSFPSFEEWKRIYLPAMLSAIPAAMGTRKFWCW